MSKNSRDNENEEFGKSWNKANKEAMDGIEESGKRFQKDIEDLG